MIHDVTDSDLGPVRQFLEKHQDSSLFLLSNLALFGPRSGEHPHSGNFRCVVEDGRIVAVFSLTRRGNLLVQAAGRADLAADILAACSSEPTEVTGVVGDWLTAQALWTLACADPRLEPAVSQKDLLFTLALGDHPISAPECGTAANLWPTRPVRALGMDDFEQWEPLNTAYLAELNLPPGLSAEQRRSEFESQVRGGRWWGAFEGGRLISIAGLNAAYGRLAQVGGVYTRPDQRRRGSSRLVMRQLIDDCRPRFARLTLFTGEDNIAARGLYESLGFRPGAAFGLFLGVRRAQARSPQSWRWQGQSGEVYTYEIHEWPARLSPGPGNYIFCASEGDAWRAILIGECADVAALAGQERRHPPGVTHVHVRTNFNPAAIRRREAADLAERWTPGAAAATE